MIIDCAIYDNGVRRPGDQPTVGVRRAASQPGSFVWIGLYEPTTEEFDAVRREFDLHELAVEDAMKAHQRPKLEVYDNTLFVVLKSARYIDLEEEIEFGEILLFIGDDFAVVVRHGQASGLTEARLSLERDPELLRMGPPAVLHRVMDRVIDDYVPVVDGLGKDIQEVEKEVFSTEWTNPAERIYFLKREVLEFQQAVASLIDPLNRLGRGFFEVIPDDMREYFRDISDHVLRLSDQVAAYRDLLTSVLEATLTQVSVRQNEDMRKISAWVAVAVVPTLIAGVFGMNFQRMPGVDASWGFPVVVGLMALVAGTLYGLFRRSDWL
ncbi:MAG: magnesium/cobalt transporter CorA [Acidimicrobiia bacterium]|nr:magnesium/cobalt transporter CorA [Acidimicrobiia bacterium]